MMGLKFLLVVFLAFILDSDANNAKTRLLAKIDQSQLDAKEKTELKTALDDYEVQLKKDKDAAKTDANLENVLKQIDKNLFEGIEGVINAFRKKSSRDFLISSFKIASSIVSAIPGGTLVGKIFGIMASTLKIYGDITNPRLNPAKVILENFQLSNLELDIAGAKEYFENFVNAGEIDYDIDATKISDTITFKKLDDEELTYTQPEVDEVIKNAKKRLELYGKLQFLISKYCTNKNEGNADDNATRMKQCMEAIKIYVKLSETHIAFLEASIKRIYNSNFSPDIKKKLSTTIVAFIARRFQRENETLYFLTDPMQFPDKADVIFELYSQQDEYGDVIKHLLALKPNGKSIFKNDRIAVCNEEKLAGLCREVRLPEKVTSNNAENNMVLGEWDWTRSVFIPPGLVVFFGKKETGGYKVGGLHGLAVYSSKYKIDYETLKITRNDKHEEAEKVRICTWKPLAGEEKRWCDTVNSNEGYFSFDNFHGVDLSNSDIDTITVPKDYNVVLSAGKDTDLTIIGPFTTKSLRLCQKKWQSVEITKIQLETTPEGKTAPNPKTSQPLAGSQKANNNDLTKVNVQRKRMSKEEMANAPRGDSLVKACTSKSGKGFCKQIFGMIFVKKINRFPTFQSIVHRFTQAGCDLNIKSLVIPAGKKVTLHSVYNEESKRKSKGDNRVMNNIDKVTAKIKLREAKSRLGPYYGPVTINNLHHATKYTLIIEDVEDPETTKEINMDKTNDNDGVIKTGEEVAPTPIPKTQTPKPKSLISEEASKRSYKQHQHNHQRHY